nr:reverse transcriptase domain, reverse transcriptase zinc-binding domain protein [Tanacetum cinerariifolium]
MNMESNWNPIIENFHKRLTCWKAKALSYGGRLTLLKLVLGALEKWVFCASFSFWNDTWLGEQCLKNTFPRLYALEQSKECKVVNRCNMLYGSKSRSWDWRRELRDGHEKDHLDGLLYLLCDCDPSDEEKIRWNRYLPIKVNILSWRLHLNRLPTRCNLDHYGIDLHTTRCPLCNEDLETNQHIFVDFQIASCCSLEPHIALVGYKTLLNLSSWADLVSLNNRVKLDFDVVLQTTFWVLWRYRNRVCFDLKPPRKDTLMDEIMVYSNSWICHRSRDLVPNWI